MKCLIKKVSAFLLLLPTVTFAGWQVAQPQNAVPSEPFFQAGSQQQDNGFVPSYGNAAFPNHYANLGRPASMYAISVSGSLKENLERIMDRYHWKVVWKAPYDYNFDGRVNGSSLPNVIAKLLKPFPLQAKLYMSNRTMIVIPRES
ncbi:MAG: hypothetical protein ACYCQI_09680 [Gammaproteobacteria bacterium]